MVQYKPLNVEETIRKMALSEKIQLLSGKDLWHTVAIPRLGIPSVRMSDGPSGVRGQKFFDGTPAAVTPCGTGLAASFDRDLVERIGEALGQESRAKGAAVILAPTTNTARSPLGGRGFESFSEDAVLSGELAGAYIRGVQSQGVVATLKHYVANDQEHKRYETDSIIPARALREVYLEPFRLAIRNSQPHAIMTAYNRVNGIHVSEDKFLLDDVLRKEWGWDGLVVSDWNGTYSTVEALQAGMDLEMPGPSVLRGAAIARQITAGKLSVADVDACVRRILKLINRAIESGIPFDAEEKMVDTPELRALLREAAAKAVVLLKNDANVLPINPELVKMIAVIGSNAKTPTATGGGSAALLATYTVSPLDAITEAAHDIGASVEYALGATTYRYLPALDPFMANGRIEFFIDQPHPEWLYETVRPLPSPDFVLPAASSIAFTAGQVPVDKLGPCPVSRFVADFTPDIGGEWEISLGSVSQGNLFVDNKLVIENTSSWEFGELFFGAASKERRVRLDLVAGKKYCIELRQWSDPRVIPQGPFVARGAIRLGACPVESPAKLRAEAVALAKKSDLAIVVVGTNTDWESEGFDRKTLSLPGEVDPLIAEVLKANPNTIIVTQAGMPVSMPWVDSAPTMLHAFFGGNELGHGISDVLFGKVNPSGRLPLTFPVRIEDTPSFHSFGITSESRRKVLYNESIMVGYKHYQRSRITPLFAFGHGLTYTSFQYDNLTTSSVSSTGSFTVTFSLTNIGKLAGEEACQVYIAPPTAGPVVSPISQLKAFVKVRLEPNEQKTVTVELEKEAFSYWDELENSWIALGGTYRVLVGSASDNVQLEGEVSFGHTFAWRGM
ncbi:hypothetical protein JCM8547_003185 [Rhodosporidiobolus lusitaniae]